MRHMGYLCSPLATSCKPAFYSNAQSLIKTLSLVFFNLSIMLESLFFNNVAFKNLFFLHSDKYILFTFSFAIWALFAQQGSSSMFQTISMLDFGFNSLASTVSAFLYVLNLFAYELQGNASALFLIFSDYFNSVNNFFGFKYNFNLVVSNPFVDIDLTANTDCEDMLVFFGDILEFVEQDKAFLADAVLDS